MKWSSVFIGGGLLALLGLAAPSNVSAAAITGHLGLSGGAVYDTRPDGGPCPLGGCQLATIDFYNFTNPDLTAGDGVVVNLTGGTDYFANINPLSTAVIRDMTNDPTDAPPSLFVPVGVDLFPGSIANFLSQFSDPDYPTLHFDITQLLLQPGPACTGGEGAGDTCVEGPFRLSESAAGGFSIKFDLLGFFRQGVDEGYYKGTFDITINNLTFSQLFARLNAGLDIGCGAQNTGPCEVQANFDPQAIPEPTTLLTFGAGSAIMAAVRRRRAAKAAKA